MPNRLLTKKGATRLLNHNPQKHCRLLCLYFNDIEEKAPYPSATDSISMGVALVTDQGELRFRVRMRQSL